MKINFIDADSVDLAERSVVQIPRDDMFDREFDVATGWRPRRLTAGADQFHETTDSSTERPQLNFYSTVHDFVAGERSTLPALSTARTRNV